MSTALIIAHALAVLVGITIGLFGGGGAILMVPILTYVAGWETEHAVTGSLFVVGVTSLFSTFLHARPTKEQRQAMRKAARIEDSGGGVLRRIVEPKGNVRWGAGLVFGLLAMVGAFFGGQLTPLLPPVVVMTIFAAVMVGSGIGMVRKKKPAAEPAPTPEAATAEHAATEHAGADAGHADADADKADEEDAAVDREASPTGGLTGNQKVKIVAAALAIGVISGLVGAGGGFLVVPALALLVGFSMPAAVGTSLLVVAMQSASGFVSHILTVDVDWATLGSLTGLAMLGTIGGTLLGTKIPAANLKRAFGVFVLFMAAFVLAQEYLLG